MIPPKYWSPTKKLMVLGAMAGGKTVEATALGNPLTFITDVSKPLKSLLIPFTPQQEGTGDPSPENIRSILPWSGLTVFGGGKNLLNPATIRKQGNDNLWWYEQDGLFLHAGTYCFTFAIKMTGFYVIDANTGTNLRTRYNSATDKFTLTEDHFIKINVYVSGGVDIDEEAMLEAGQTATAYEPYHPITETDIVFPSPVYGGTLDIVSGVLTVEWKGIVFDGSEDEGWEKRPQGSASAFAMKATVSNIKDIENQTFIKASYLKTLSASATWGNYDNWISQIGNIIITGIQSITTVEAWCEYLAENPLTVVYELATPQEIQLTPAQITALVGNNTIWSDADGQMAAVFLKKG